MPQCFNGWHGFFDFRQLGLTDTDLLSTEPIASIAKKLDEIENAVARLGCPFPDPLLTLITLTGAAIPYLRICEEGLVNLKDGKTVGLFVE